MEHIITKSTKKFGPRGCSCCSDIVLQEEIEEIVGVFQNMEAAYAILVTLEPENRLPGKCGREVQYALHLSREGAG